MAKKTKHKKKTFLEENLSIIIFAAIVILLIGASLLYKSSSETKEIVDDKIYGDDVIVMHYFHWTRCPHCIEQNKFNKYLKEKYPNLKIIEHEVTEPQTPQIYEEFAKNFSNLPNSWNQFPGTPLTIIGNHTNIGFGTPETTGKLLVSFIEDEISKINQNWDDKTMKRTVDLN